MTLSTDIPTRPEIDALWETTAPASVSLYVPTEPASNGDAERIAFKNLARAALDQLADVDKHHLAALEDAFADLEEDDEFWRHQARTLAVFATPGWVRTFRLPNRLNALAVAGDRLHVKPLMRAVTFPQTAFVLALAQGSVRLLETVPDAGRSSCGCRTCRATSRAPSASRRSKNARRSAGSRATRGRRCGCASTPGGSTTRCARCCPGTVCRW